MDEANPFDSFDVPPPASEPLPKAAAPAEKNPFDDFEDDRPTLSQGPSAFSESFKTNLYGPHGLGGLGATAVDAVASARAKSVISNAEKNGIAKNEDLKSPQDNTVYGADFDYSYMHDSMSPQQVTQIEYDRALQTLSRQKDAYQNYEAFESRGFEAKAGALLGSIGAGIVDPTNLLFGSKPIALAGAEGIRLLEQAGMNKIVAKIAVGAGEFGAIGAASDAATQGLDIAGGLQTSFDAQRLVLSAAIGAGLGGFFKTVGEATSIIKALKGADPMVRPPAQLATPEPRPITPEPSPIPEPAPAGEPAAIEPVPPAAAPKINGVEIPPFESKEPVIEGENTPPSQAEPSAEFKATEAWRALPTPDNAPMASSAAGMPKQATPAPIGPLLFNAAELKTDAKAMQYKGEADESGVTSRLAGTNKWDQSASGRIVVFQRENGDMIVVNGHQRTGLAKRMLADGSESRITMVGDLYREIDGYTPAQMRAIGAGINIKEGTGTSLDAARILRDYPKLLDGSFNLSDAKTKESVSLARLDDEAFRFVTNDIVPEHFGGLVGEIIPNDGPRQLAAMKAIVKFKPASRDQAAALVQNVRSSELAKAHAGAQGSMFGDFESAESTAGEQMRVVAQSIAELKSDKSLFSRVNANADRIEQTGSTISRQSARSAVQDAQTFSKFISSEAYSKGPIRDALERVAGELKNGSITESEAARQFQSTVRSEAERILHARDEASRARRASAAGPAESGGGQKEGQRQAVAATEPGADGKLQSLIPGVDPVTDRARLELEAGKPMRGGDAAPGGMFDQDAMNQDELFLRRRQGPHGPDPESRRFVQRARLPNEAETIVGPRQPISDQEVRAHKINDAMKAIAERLGARLEMDGRGPSGTLGSYQPKQGVMRILYAGDLETFSHEMGHKIDQALTNDPITAQGWKDLVASNEAKLKSIDYNSRVTGKAPTAKEGIAEFIRQYVNNPAAAAKVAPKIFSEFSRLVGSKPEIEAALLDAAKLSQIESGLSATQVFSSMIAGGHKSGLEKMSQDMARHGIVPTLSDYAAVAYGAIVRENVHFDRLTQFLRDKGFEKTGEPIRRLSFLTDPDHLYRQLPGAEQMAQAIMDKGVPLDPSDPFRTERSTSLYKGISDILNASISRVANDGDPLIIDSSAYLVARRAKGDWSLYHRGDIPKPPVGASEQETIRAIADFELKYPHFQEAANKIFEFQSAYLQRRVDKGLLKQASADAMEDAHYDYVPLYRDFGEEKSGGGDGSDGRFAGLEHSDIKRFSGSSRDVKNVLRSMMEDVMRTERRIAENDVLVAIDNLAERAGELAGPVWSKIPNSEISATTVDVERALRALGRENGMSLVDIDIMISNMAPMVGEDMTATLFGRTPTSPRGERVLFMYRGGERKAIKVGDNEISKHFYDLMTSMSAPEKDLFIKTVSEINAAFQSSITHAPRFLTGTALRDNATRMFLPRNQGVAGRIPLMQEAVGAYTMIFDRAFYEAYSEHGGIRGAVYSHAAGEARHDPLAGAALTNGFVSKTMQQMADANTFGEKAGVIVSIPWTAIKSSGEYGESLVNRVRYKEGLPAQAYAIATTPLKIAGDFLKLTEIAETANRVGNAKLTFNYLKRQWLSDAEALAGALFESRDMLNYDSKGGSMRTAGRIFPFMKAGLTGADRSARGLISEPIQSAIRAYQRGGYANLDARDKAALAGTWKNTLFLAAAAGAVYSIYYPYASKTEFYKRASPYMRETYLHLQAGDTEDGTPVGMTLHKGYDVSAAVLNMAERLAEEHAKNHPTDWAHVLGASKEAVPRHFRSWEGFLSGAAPFKTAYEVATGMRLGVDGQPPSPIVPREMNSKSLEQQVTATTWAVSQMIGKQFGVSPMVVDHVINSMGGTMGQDIRELSSAVFDNNPLTTVGGALNKFFFGQIYREATRDVGAGRDLRSIMATNHDSYNRQAQGYLDAKRSEDYALADSIYNRADETSKTLMVLRSSSNFSGDLRQLHPLERSSAIATAIYAMDKDLGRSQILVQKAQSEKKDAPRKVIVLNEGQSRKLHAQFNSLMSEETRNGLAMAKYPGYEDFPIIDTSARMEIIKSISPEAAAELSSRMKRLHILPALGLSKVWGEVKNRLLTSQEGAKLRDLVSSAKQGP